MAEFGDFELSGDPKALPPTASLPAESAPRPEQEAAEPPFRRGRLSSLVAPALILVAAVAILSMRPPEPTWNVGDSSTTTATESPTTFPLVVRVAPVSAEGVPTGTVPTPVIEASPGPPGESTASAPPLELLTATDARAPEARPDPEKDAEKAPAARMPALPERKPEPIAAAPVPAPAAVPAPAEAPRPFTVAVPHDPIQTRLAVASIAAEARREQEEAARMAALRSTIQQVEKERVAEQVNSERESAGQRRVAFRRELAAILQRDGDHAAPEIWRLVESQHVEPSPVAEQAIAKALRSRRGQLGRADRVDVFRENGLDESLIFAELYREQLTMMSARRGPRTREEAVVRAARALLALELDPATASRAVARP